MRTAPRHAVVRPAPVGTQDCYGARKVAIDSNALDRVKVFLRMIELLFGFFRCRRKKAANCASFPVKSVLEEQPSRLAQPYLQLG
jgi:hypothetical protein